MSETEIITKVRDILNEHGGDDAISIGTDRVLLEDYIKSAIPDAVVMLAQKGYVVNRKQYTKEDSGTLDENMDFISLVVATCKEWNRPIHSLTSVDSPVYAMAQNEFTKPGPNSPIAWWDNDARGSQLRFAPWKEIEPVNITYNAKYDTKTGINAEPKETTAVCYMTAAFVLGMFGDDNGKQRLSDISMNMLQ
jgi:hypothetical protein